MGFGSVTHWVILLVIVVLIFGTKKLKNIGSDLGSAVKGFKDGVKGGADSKSNDAASTPAEQVTTSKGEDSNTVDVEAKTKS